MDIEAYRTRTKMTVAELAKLLGVKEAAIYNYKYGKSKPSYESVEKLLLNGALLSEVFSEEVQKKVFESAGALVPPQDIYNSPEFREGVAMAVADMKAKGMP